MEASPEMRRNRALVDLALALRRLDLPAFMREAVRRTREVLEVETCKVLEFLVDGDRLLPRADDRVAFEAQALIPKTPAVVENACQESRFEWTALLRGHGLVSGVSAVIHANGRPFGILSAYSTSRRCYTEGEAAFLQDTAELLGMAAERALSEESYLRALEKDAVPMPLRRGMLFCTRPTWCSPPSPTASRLSLPPHASRCPPSPTGASWTW